MSDILINNLENKYNNYKIVVADTDLSTFEELNKLKDKYSFINLGSDFAVNFIIEYEKIDIILINSSITSSLNLTEKILKKKIKLFILGKDIQYPIDNAKVDKFLEDKIKKMIKTEKSKFCIKKYFLSFLSSNSKLKEKKQEIKKNNEKVLNKNLIEIKNGYEDNNYKISTKKETDFPKNEKIDFSCNCNGSHNFLKEGEEENKKLNEANVTPEILSDSNEIENELNLYYRNNSLSNNFFSTKKSNKNYIIKTVKQKVVVLLKAKGGVGGTLIALYLGYLLKDLKIVVLDLNFSEGGSDFCYYLDIPKVPNLSYFTESYDKKALNNSYINVTGNFDIIQSPPSYELSKRIDLKDIYSLIDIAKKKYDLIIIDTPNKIDDFYLGITDLADLLVAVSDSTSSSLGRILNIIEKYIYLEIEKLLIINKFCRNNLSDINLSSIKTGFNITDIVFLQELKELSSKSKFEFKELDRIYDFKVLANKAINVLTK